MKILELREKTEKELLEMMTALKEKGRELRFQHAAGKVKNTQEMHESRRTIAKIQTIMREKR
ncbi:MAG: 50S ribosomal protein L29 [bacterium]|nr:50S ribosomal protein L29 [bacterium]